MTERDIDAIDFELDDALVLLERTPQMLRAWLDGLPPRWLHAREGAGSWSPHDVVGHLVHGERTDWLPRLRQMLEGRGDRRFEPFDREAMLGISEGPETSDLLDELARLRSRNVAALRELAPGPTEQELPGTHPELGPVNVRQLLSTWVAHDQTHISQIARVMAKQYRHEVGPWRAYLPLLDRETGGSGGSAGVGGSGGAGGAGGTGESGEPGGSGGSRGFDRSGESGGSGGD